MKFYYRRTYKQHGDVWCCFCFWANQSQFTEFIRRANTNTETYNEPLLRSCVIRVFGGELDAATRWPK